MQTFKTFLNEEMNNKRFSDIITQFIPHCRKRLKIKNLPEIKFITDTTFSSRRGTFGMYDDKLKLIVVTVKNRQVMDILRTLAHELSHYSFHTRKLTNITYNREVNENEATKLAGLIMRDFECTHPKLFNIKSF